MAYGMILRLTSRPGMASELVAALTAVDASLRDGAGCLFHVVGRDAADPAVVLVAEAWASEDAHAAWRARPGVQELIDRVRAAATGPPEVTAVDWRAGSGVPPL